MSSQENQESGQENNRKNQKRNIRENKRDTSPLREYAKYSTIGFQMVVIILLAILGGMKLDEWVTGIDFPLFALLGAIVGVALSLYYAIKDFL